MRAGKESCGRPQSLRAAGHPAAGRLTAAGPGRDLAGRGGAGGKQSSRMTPAAGRFLSLRQRSWFLHPTLGGPPPYPEPYRPPFFTSGPKSQPSGTFKVPVPDLCRTLPCPALRQCTFRPALPAAQSGCHFWFPVSRSTEPLRRLRLKKGAGQEARGMLVIVVQSMEAAGHWTTTSGRLQARGSRRC